MPRLLCGDEDLLFPIRRDSYGTAVARAAAAAGVEHWCPLQIRHSAGTAVRAEYGIEGAQHHLGHARADVTQIYAETSLEQAKTVALRIG